MNSINFQKEFTLKQGLLFVVSGPSGAGKSLMCQEYIKKNPKTLLSISETTRKPRKNEINGREYYFIDEELFSKRVNEDYYLEYAGKFQNHYGTPKKPITQALKEGRDVILEIEPQGAAQVRKAFPSVISIFVLPISTNELIKQIKGRKTETEEQINLRLSDLQKEIEQIRFYDYIIINRFGHLKESVKLLEDIAQSERCSVKRILKQKEGKNE